MDKILSFNSPKIVGNELKNIKRLNSLNQFSSNGFFTKKCEQWLVKNINCKEALLVHSCTAALEMCALLLNIKKDDEIIMPSYTFVSTANAFVLRGGSPVFVDIDPNTCNIDTNKIEEAITKKTKAIVVVHYAGISCDMDPILKIAKKYKLYVIEDAAHAILSSYKGKPLGSIGDLATLSFHESKNIHCGEGGALLINNKKFIKRAKIIRDKGTNRDEFNRNKVKSYKWIDIGSSYGLSEINAAFLLAQLENAKKTTNKRKIIFNIYHNKLKKLEQLGFIKRATVPHYSGYNGHIYYVHVLKKKRSDLIRNLKKNYINSLFHYIPLHSSPFSKKKNFQKLLMKHTNTIASTLIRLPINSKITKSNIKKIYKIFTSFYKISNKY